MTAVLFRRRRLGLGSCTGIAENSRTGITVRTHNPLRRTFRREGEWPDDTSLVFRWGCTARIPVDCNRVVNTVEAINLVNDKARFRRVLMDHAAEGGELLCPKTWSCFDEWWGTDHAPGRRVSVIVRPRTHAQGRNLHVCRTVDEVDAARVPYLNSGYYISELINKVSEYRVFCVQGRVVWVARKTPGNPEEVAWNVARGGRFDNVRWGDWPLRAVRITIEAFNLSGLDFGGVDIMVDDAGRCYVVEINSAPSQTSPYRIESTAKAFDYIIANGKQPIPLTQERGGWRKFIHPALSDEALLIN